MKKIMSILALAAALPVYTGAGTSFAQDSDARLGSVTGTVDVLAQGEADSWREAEEEMPLSAGDKVRTGGDSSAEITLDGGGVIRLGADSAMEISSLAPASSSFFLRLGSLVAKIGKELRKREARLSVRTPSAVCAVRGTEFGVEYDGESGETTAGVFDEGSLSVSSTDEEGKAVAEETVEKGSEVRLRAGARAFKPGAMRRLLRHRKALQAARGRLGVLRKNWKRLDPEKRQELRKRFLARRTFQGKRAMDKRGARPQEGAGRAGTKGAPGQRLKPALLEKVKQRAAERRGGPEKGRSRGK